MRVMGCWGVLLVALAGGGVGWSTPAPLAPIQEGACPAPTIERAGSRVRRQLQALLTYPQLRAMRDTLRLPPGMEPGDDTRRLTDPEDTETCRRLRSAIAEADSAALARGRRYMFFRVRDVYFVPSEDPPDRDAEEGVIVIDERASPMLIFSAEFRLLWRVMG